MTYAIIGIFILGPLFGILAIVEANAAERLGYPNQPAKVLGIIVLCAHLLAIGVFFIAPAMVAAWTTFGTTTGR
jgi:hypothetical protein